MTRARDIVLRRTGHPALRLTGYGLCASATSRAQRGARQTRWHDLELWSHDERISGPEQRHALSIKYCTQWKGELGHDSAVLVLRRDLVRVLGEYDPLRWLTGYPTGEQYAERRRRLELELRSGWESAVSDLLEQAKVWELGDP